MSITVKIEHQYGQRRVVPVCEKAHAFAAIAGTKTLTDSTLTQIKYLGFAVEVQQEKI